MQWMFKLVLTLLIAASVLAAGPEPTGALPTDAQALNQQMRDLMLVREQVLAQLAEDAKLAPLSERVTRDAEYAYMQAQYEIQFLELLVEYYELTGNAELRERAEANLHQQLSPAATGTPEPSANNREQRNVVGEGR